MVQPTTAIGDRQDHDHNVVTKLLWWADAGRTAFAISVYSPCDLFAHERPAPERDAATTEDERDGSAHVGIGWIPTKPIADAAEEQKRCAEALTAAEVTRSALYVAKAA
jgi:hypothetical protein